MFLYSFHVKRVSNWLWNYNIWHPNINNKYTGEGKSFIVNDKKIRYLFQEYNIKIWDTAGQEEYENIRT